MSDSVHSPPLADPAPCGGSGDLPQRGEAIAEQRQIIRQRSIPAEFLADCLRPLIHHEYKYHLRVLRLSE